MTRKKYHFFSLQTATNYHLARMLDSLGWERVDNEEDAHFSEENLTLDNTVSQNLEYKHLLAQLLEKHHINVMPLTYALDDDNKEDVFAKIIYDHYLSDQQIIQERPGLKWILKPSMLNNAENIKLFDDIQEVKKYYGSSNRLGGPHVLQQYIDAPALTTPNFSNDVDFLNAVSSSNKKDRKFTFRIHVFVTNFGGIYLYHRGYMNISAVPYDLSQGFENKKMHITNYMLDGVQSHITQQTTDQLPEFDGVIYPQMKKIITSVFLALLSDAPKYLKTRESITTKKENVASQANRRNDKNQANQINRADRFEIFGCDFLLDNKNKLWLLEINQRPDAPMYEDNPLKPILWTPFWNDVVQKFVLPIANHSARPIHHQHFESLLTAGECRSWWRRWLKKIFL